MSRSLVYSVLSRDVSEYVQTTIGYAKDWRLMRALSPFRMFALAFNVVYILLQRVIVAVFTPPSLKCREPLSAPYGRIAVIGAGLTGISSAAHVVAHNFEVVIYEANSREKLGGIWAHVNKTSGLQLNSLAYRFHPAVLWSRAFPQRDEILGEINRIWREYGLEERTKFNTPVESVRRAPDDGTKCSQPRWIINDGEDGIFNAVIVTVGTCGKPKWIKLDGMPEDLGKEENSSDSKGKDTESQENDTVSPGALSYAEAVKHEPPHQDGGGEVGGEYTEQVDMPEAANSPKTYAQALKNGSPGGDTASGPKLNGDSGPSNTEIFKCPIIHSSQLDTVDGDKLAGKRIVVIGSGASGVEAVETALERCGKKGKVWMIARSDKWVIPRNILIDTFLACQPFGRQMPLSFLWEAFLTWWHYRGVEDLVPADRGIFEGTPVVNDDFLEHVRTGRCVYIRGDPIRCTSTGVVVNARRRGSNPKDEGQEKQIDADIIVLATGFQKPDVNFLEKSLFPEGYERPDLYLQNFSTEDWSILMTNSAYQNAIGTVGHVHIGIYTRILLVLLMDENARPTSKDMKLWVDVIRFVKRGATGGAFGFFTYAELSASVPLASVRVNFVDRTVRVAIWLLGFHLLRPDRARWVLFIMQGWGKYAK